MKPNYIDRFVALMGPSLYRELARRNVDNIGVVYDNMMRQFAGESDYGRSDVAVKLNNYGGYGYNGETYSSFKDINHYINAYLDLIQSRYPKALAARNSDEFAHALKKGGYYEAPEAEYAATMRGMKSLHKSLVNHARDNWDLYSDTPFRPLVQLKTPAFTKNYYKDLSRAVELTADPRELYDYTGYVLDYGTLDPTDTSTGHYVDTYKLPGHPTFSNESVYSNANTPGGSWDYVNGHDVFRHSDFTMKHPTLTYDYLQKNDPNTIATYGGGVVLPETVITGKNKSGRKLPPLKDTIDNYIQYQWLKDSGLLDDDDNINSFMFFNMLNGLKRPNKKQ